MEKMFYMMVKIAHSTKWIDSALDPGVDGDVKSQFAHFVRQVFVAMQAMEDPLSVPQQHVSPVDQKILFQTTISTSYIVDTY